MRAGRAIVVAGAFLVVAAATAHAAQSPFGIATPDSSGNAGFAGPLGPAFAWIALRQAEFYRAMTAALSAAKADGSAAWILLGLSFAYGVFHAAGPGHGKAVISSYLLASGETARRGILISFAAAFVQALVAIGMVAVAAIVLRATAQSMTEATDWIEIVSYALIASVGAFLLWSKIFGGHHHHHQHVTADKADGHGHNRHDHDRRPEYRGRTRLVGGDGQAVARSWFARPWTAVMAVGIRPCSGAIIVLVFALSQGLFAIGMLATLVMALGTGVTVAMLAILAVAARGLAVAVAGTKSRAAGITLKAVEIAGASVVLLFGLVLLGGALSAGLPG